MLKQPLFLISFIIISIIGALHYLALKFYLYWVFPWFDILMHFLGGLWVGLIVMWFLFFSGFINKNINETSRVRVFYVSILSVLIVGLLWEVFEFYTGVMILETNYGMDTIIDLIMDILGASVAATYVLVKYKKRQIDFIYEQK